MRCYNKCTEGAAKSGVANGLLRPLDIQCATYEGLTHAGHNPRSQANILASGLSERPSVLPSHAASFCGCAPNTFCPVLDSPHVALRHYEVADGERGSNEQGRGDGPCPGVGFDFDGSAGALNESRVF